MADNINENNQQPIDKKQQHRQIITTSLWFAGIFVVGILFKFVLELTKPDDFSNQQRAEEAIIQGVVSVGKVDYPEALEQFNKAIKLDTANSYAYMYRGRTYFILDKYTEALPDLNKAVEKGSVNYEAYTYRADLYYAIKDYSKAFADYNKSIQIQPNAEAYRGKGNVYLEMNDPAEAINSYTKAIELKPDYDEAYFLRGWVYNHQGERAKAIADFNKAIELNADEEKYRENLEFATQLQTVTE